MVDLRIGLHTYHLPLDWSDITLKEAIQFHKVCIENIPKDLTEKYRIL